MMRLRLASTYLIWLYAFLTAYVALSFSFGQPFQPVFTPILTLLALVFALLHGAQRIGWKRILLLLALTFLVSLIFESIGVATGRVYGKYHYTARLGPKFLGLVPYLIPAAWFMMIYPSFVIAERLAPAGGKAWQRKLGIAALGGIIMTAWDLGMDPLMVAGGHWVWDEPGSYFGVPVQNYWGWWLTTFITFALFLWLSTSLQQKVRNHSQDDLDGQAVISYAITGSSTILISFQSGLGGSALVGLFAMLPWIIAYWGKASLPSEPQLEV